MPKWTTYASKTTKIQSKRGREVVKRNGNMREEDALLQMCAEITRGITAATGRRLDCAESRVEDYLCMISYMTAMMWHEGKGTHLFLPPGMTRFLIDAVRHLDGTEFKMAAMEPLSSIKQKVWYCLHGPFFVHMPKNECIHTKKEKHNEGFNIDKGSICYFFDPNQKQPGAYIYLSTNDCGVSILNKDEIAGNFTDDVNTSVAMRLFIGLSLYIDAFPDALQDFMPHEVEWNGRGRRCYGITPNKEVQEDIDHSVSPHYRRGHMRLLTSERYTEEKRGKAVFVKGCFVKGRAYELVG